MTRKELYARIKELNLQQKVQEMWGKNFTQVSNERLEATINEATKPCKCKKEVKKEEKCNHKAENALSRLISVLYNKHILLDSEVDFIINN